MKFKRMLSLLMAVLMVVSTLAGFTISAAADEPDADSAEILHGYIRTGLFAWYSGEQNQREGQNNDASVWHDLVGGHDLTVKTDGNNYFTEEGLHVKTAKHYFDDDIVAVVNADSFTVEIEFGEFSSVGTTFNTFMNSSNDNFALFRRNGTDQIEFKHAGLPGDQRPKTGNALENLNNSLITITFEQGGTVKLFVNGERKKTKDAPNLMGANDLFIGHDDVSKDFEAIFKNIRFYTRALSEAEVLHNAAVDGYADVKNKYVQDGLVSLYSGVSNTEAGYDANASVWADLVGENDLPITSNEMNYFTREGFRVEGDTTIQYFPQPIVDLVNAESFSVEISFGEFREVGSAYGTFLNSTNDNFALFRQVSDNRIAFKFGGNPGNE